MLDAILRVVGVDKPVVREQARVRPEKSEVTALICNFGKATAAFGYEPRIDFDEGLRRLLDHLHDVTTSADPASYTV